MYLQREGSHTTAEELGWSLYDHQSCHIPLSTQSCWSPAAGCAHATAACTEELHVVGLSGREGECLRQKRVLPGSGFVLILLLTCCLHLSPSLRAALLSISFQHMHVHHKATPAPISPFPPMPAGVQDANTPCLSSNADAHPLHTPHEKRGSQAPRLRA